MRARCFSSLDAVRVLVAVPTYVEAENIEELLTRVRAAAPDVDVLVIDDNSPDGTADVADRAAARLGRIEVLRRPAKKGLGNAYRAGFGIGIDRGYELICQMDADLSHDPAALPLLIQAVEDGADLAIGSRYVPGGEIPHWPAYRRAASKYGNLYASYMLGTGIKDATAGYRVYRAKTLEGIEFEKTHANGYLFQIELAYRAWLWGGRTVEVPICFTDRVRGYSKMSFNVVFEEMAMVTWWGIRDRVSAPRRAARRRARRLAAGRVS
jgi:dolichol-phosphate mannosyltransferase